MLSNEKDLFQRFTPKAKDKIGMNRNGSHNDGVIPPPQQVRDIFYSLRRDFVDELHGNLAVAL